MCLRPQSIVVKDERVDGFIVYASISDPRLLLNGENYQAKFLDDRSGFAIREPSLPSWFTDDIELMKSVEGKYSSGVCAQTFEEHKMRMAEYLQDKSRHFKYTIIKFPDGMKGSNAYFNEGVGNQSSKKNNLITKTRLMQHEFDDKKGNKFQFITTYAYWKIAVEGTQRTTDEKSAVVLDDLFGEAIRGLQRM